MSKYGISLFRVSPDGGDRDRDVPFPVSPSPVDGQDPKGINPDEIDENKKNEKERDMTNGKPTTPGQDKEMDKDKVADMDEGDENSKKLQIENQRVKSPNKELCPQM